MKQCCYLAAFDVLNDDSLVEGEGRRTISWRWLAHYGIGMLGQVSLNEPWNAPANSTVAQDTHSMFAEKGTTTATVFALRGPGSAFDAAIGKGLETLPNDSAILIEVCGENCHWLEPGDVYLSGETPAGVKKIQLQRPSRCEKGFLLGFADGAVWLMSPDTPLEAIEKMAMVEVAHSREREDLLGPYALERREAFLSRE